MTVQAGITTFKYVDKTLICSPFNFYIYPLDHTVNAKTFISNAGSLIFLSQNNFDFNKWIYESIGFIPQKQLENYNLAVEMRKAEQEKLKISIDPSSTDTIIYCNSKFLEIRDWIKKCVKENDYSNPLIIDLKLTPFKYFYGLAKNILKMFPKQSFEGQKFECEIIEDLNLKDLHIKLTLVPTNANDQQTIDDEESQALFRTESYKALNTFLQSHKLRNTPMEIVFEEILNFLSEAEKSIFTDSLKQLIVEQTNECRRIISENASNKLLEFLGELIINNTAICTKINDEKNNLKNNVGFTSLVSHIISTK